MRCSIRLLFVCLFAVGGLMRIDLSAAENAAPPAGGGLEALTSPDTLLADPAHAAGWRDLFEKLAPNKTRQSSFEERRYFPFRKTPVVLQGEIRIVPRLGLSLRYMQPE